MSSINILVFSGPAFCSVPERQLHHKVIPAFMYLQENSCARKFSPGPEWASWGLEGNQTNKQTKQTNIKQLPSAMNDSPCLARKWRQVQSALKTQLNDGLYVRVGSQECVPDLKGTYSTGKKSQLSKAPACALTTVFFSLLLAQWCCHVFKLVKTTTTKRRATKQK